MRLPGRPPRHPATPAEVASAGRRRLRKDGGSRRPGDPHPGAPWIGTRIGANPSSVERERGGGRGRGFTGEGGGRKSEA